MSGLGWAVAGLGMLIILTRGPLIFAPVATLGVYRRLFASALAIRGVGVAAAGVGLALVATSEGSEGVAADLATALGWTIASGSILFLVILPNVIQPLAEMILELIADVARPIGVLAVAAGLLLIWLGVAVL